MGIHGLWNIVKPAAAVHTLPDYCDSCTIRKLGPDCEPSKLPVVGVDAAIWMNEVQAIFHGPRHINAGENPELKTLVLRLGSLLEMCAIPVFVFDGPERPEMKRGKKVLKAGHWLEGRFQEFILAFGFHVHTAPGEAEAELAHLNKAGKIDIIITTDSDALVFGAQCIAKSVKVAKDKTPKMKTNAKGKTTSTKMDRSEKETEPKMKPRKGEVEVYHLESIATHSDVSLTKGGLQLVALINGGDYDNGLKGCGSSIAHGLALVGLGDSLREAYMTMEPADFEAFLPIWRHNFVDELVTNHHHRLACCEPALATKVPPSFPDVNIIRLYASPVVLPANIVNGCHWASQGVDMKKLVQLCEVSFTWGTEKGIAEFFRKHVFGGVAFRQLVEFDTFGTGEQVREAAILPPAIFRVLSCARTTAAHISKRYLVKVYINQIQQTISTHLQGLRPQDPLPKDDYPNHFINFHPPRFLIDPIRPFVKWGKVGKLDCVGPTEHGTSSGPITSAQLDSDEDRGENTDSSEDENSSDEDSDSTPPPSISNLPSASLAAPKITHPSTISPVPSGEVIEISDDELERSVGKGGKVTNTFDDETIEISDIRMRKGVEEHDIIDLTFD